MTQRNKDKFVLKTACEKLMREDEDLCGDNTHKLTAILFEKKYGAELTEDMIKFIDSVGRARRSVLKSNPELDMRTVTKAVLEPADREYYSGE